MNIEEYQGVLIGLLEKGKPVRCECCGQLCKVYPRRLNSEMARFLIRLVKVYESKRDWVHVRELLSTDTFASSNGTLLKHWGFLIHREKDPSNTEHRTSGYWKPTKAAIDFVYNFSRVPSHALLYDKHLVGWSETTTSISEALGKKFDYQELMSKTHFKEARLAQVHAKIARVAKREQQTLPVESR